MGSESTSGEGSFGWVKWFCSQKPNAFLIEVDEDYIADKFNLTGLFEQTMYDSKIGYAVITDQDEEEELPSPTSPRGMCAVELYTLIHARYLLSPKGLQIMAERFKNKEFGSCPRVHCNQQQCLPVGLTDQCGKELFKLFCPKCQDVYNPKMTRSASRVDGAFFGSAFPHLLLLTYPELQPPISTMKYEPKLFGFRIHPSARKGKKAKIINVHSWSNK